MKQTNSKSVVLYARNGAIRNAEDENSVVNQLRHMRNYCETHNYEIVGEYVDDGISASANNRPGLDALTQKISKSGESVGAIIVHSFSRLFRNVGELGIYLRDLRKVGTRLVSVTQDVDDTPISRFAMLFYGLVDELTLAENSKLMKRAKLENAKLGFFNGSKPPYGYSVIDTDVKIRNGFKRKLALNSTEAHVVRLIYKLAINDDCDALCDIPKIAMRLNAAGHSYRGKQWTPKLVLQILTSKTYCGDMFFNRWNRHKNAENATSEWVVTKVPVIVTKQDFDQAAARFAAPALIGTTKRRLRPTNIYPSSANP